MSAASRPPSSSPYFLITPYGKPNTLCRCCTRSAQAMTRFTSAPRSGNLMLQPSLSRPRHHGRTEAGAGQAGGKRWVDVPLLAGEHRGRLALEVEVRLAADVDRDPLDGAAGEPVGPLARVIAGDRRAAVATDAQALPGQLEVAGLVPDPPFADLAVAVVQGQHAGGDARGIFAVLVEGCGQDQVLPGGQVLGRNHVLLVDAHEVVDVVQPAVLHVQRVAAEPGPMGEDHPLGAGRGDV